MNIQDKRKKIVKFKDYQPGQLFHPPSCRDVIYMATGDTGKAVNMFSGNIEPYHPENSIVPIPNATLTLES